MTKCFQIYDTNLAYAHTKFASQSISLLAIWASNKKFPFLMCACVCVWERERELLCLWCSLYNIDSSWQSTCVPNWSAHLCSRQARTFSARALVPVIRNVAGRFSLMVERNWSHSLSAISPCPWTKKGRKQQQQQQVLLHKKRQYKAGWETHTHTYCTPITLSCTANKGQTFRCKYTKTLIITKQS